MREEMTLMRAHWWPILGLGFLLQGPGCTQEEDYVPPKKAGDVLGDYVLEGAADYRGRTSEFGSRVLLIHFFETGSRECRAQVEQIRGLWFPHRAAGMNVIAVCPETDGKKILSTVKEWTLPYPVFLDPQRNFTREFAPRKYPWNVVVGRNGTILFSGKGNWEHVQSAVEEAIRVKAEGPDHVCVQHLLIAFKGSVRGKKIERSKQDAAKLAAELFERAKEGADFSELVKKHSSDASPGTYNLANFNVDVDDDNDESERGNRVQSFGDVAFSLEVGEIGLAEYHSLKSRFGWHIIKRLE